MSPYCAHGVNVRDFSCEECKALEVEQDLELDRLVYGSCYWKVKDGRKVRIHPKDIRYGLDGVPRDSSNTAAERLPDSGGVGK
jgi:hypothetical protein